MIDFNSLVKNLKKKDFVAGKTYRLAVLADSASQFIVKAIKGMGIQYGVAYEIFEADYNQIDLQVFDNESELYRYNPSFVLLLQSTEKLLKQFSGPMPAGREMLAEYKKEYVRRLYRQIKSNLNCKVIINSFPEWDDAVFGNFSSKTNLSFPYQLKKTNLALMELSQEEKDLYLLRLDSLAGNLGYAKCFDPRMYVTADMVHSFDLLPSMAKNVHDIIQAIQGNFKKCLILDLDNTLWGGIIGDDGLEGIQIGDLGIGKPFTDLQLWALELKKRGILLAVCSKNTHDIAREPFDRHPDMKLHYDDFAVFMANWETKVDNIRHIQRLLNIGLDSMVFLDDNPFERDMVRQHIPDITVPELPEDPAEYIPFLRTMNLFETASFTEEDAMRTSQYQTEFERTAFQQTFTDEAAYLSSLEMTAIVAPFDEFAIPRIAQLSQRSNQFNLRTVRYTDADIRNIALSERHLTLSFRLSDKFGDYGLIAYVILEKRADALFIDSWVMSCRVLKRSMEEFTLRCILDLARAEGYALVQGEYIPTKKNQLVKDHYEKLGFTSTAEGGWVIDTVNFSIQKEIYIHQKEALHG